MGSCPVRGVQDVPPGRTGAGGSSSWGLACRKCSPHRLELVDGATDPTWEDTYISVLVCGGTGKLKERVERLEVRAVSCPSSSAAAPRMVSLAPGLVVFCDNPLCGEPSVISYALHDYVSSEEGEKGLDSRGSASLEQEQRWKISEYYTRMCVAGEMMLGTLSPGQQGAL